VLRLFARYTSRQHLPDASMAHVSYYLRSRYAGSSFCEYKCGFSHDYVAMLQHSTVACCSALSFSQSVVILYFLLLFAAISIVISVYLHCLDCLFMTWWQELLCHLAVVCCALSPVYSDTTQLNSTRRPVELSWVELCRYKTRYTYNMALYKSKNDTTLSVPTEVVLNLIVSPV